MNIILFILLSLCPILSFSMPTEPIRIIPFQENQVVRVDANILMVTAIQFSQDEQITSIQNGDMAAWAANINNNSPNTVFIKPTMSGSDTNMVIITNQHTYYFHLLSHDHSEHKNSATVYALKFRYPKNTDQQIKPHSAQSSKTYYWNYSFHGDSSILPLHVFDDGHFTYFQLREGQSFPAIFSVETRDGKESVVNYRREGNDLVVLRVAPQFTLRSGKHQIISIFNNRLIGRSS